MNENRPTKIITTPSGKEAVIKTYLTARERNEIRAVFLCKMKLNAASQRVEEVGGEALSDAEYTLIRLAVVSYDGSAENVLDRLLDGTPVDYDFIVKETNSIGGDFK